MKLFKQLLVAPAALGLLAPVAATAAELNLDGVNKYASEEQVTSISQFSDVKPTDWAYQALSNLIERYGCVAGYPDGTYKGGRAMTRFEAAALLNACLDRVTEVTDELKKLMAEFEKELAILKGRVDGLEAKVGELEANQFSTTTKLKGIATFVVGGASAAVNPDTVTEQAEQVSFNYDVRLILDTSFTGKDLLRTTLRAGNFGESAFGGGNTLMEVAFQEEAGPDVVSIDRLFYQFPIGENFTATFGGKVRQDDMLAMWPSVYPADSILDRFTYGGANNAYSLNLGAGVGLWYEKDGFSLSANYVSNEASAEVGTNNGVGTTAGTTNGGGFGDGSTTTIQVGYSANNWGAAIVYNYIEAANIANAGGTYSAVGSNNYGFSAYWQPEESGLIPSISAGFGASQWNGSNPNDDSWSWMVGLQWDDAFMKGNAFGIGLGHAPTNIAGTINNSAVADTLQEKFGIEVWYKFQVTDNISVTPGFFWIDGGGVDLSATGGPRNEDTYGVVLKTTFKF
ncbi:carbohydrate porin [Cyanobium sp. Alchichica 3B3-8F6]|uniref:iron uptake porin n=1 Tax=Cyanobium sp. Alchichica 3B3-8F6 TaxID=2823696 RepID=UPI0020CC57D7|nr:iron uptake porin [Cyanobium sp. Alchichica 3B3-8F6]MCP9882345.1 carbohydrate porin [Cyanobium sp. Alchichica 3B3-8F6]